MNYEMDSQSLLDMLRNFFDYVTDEVFNPDMYGLVMHMFSAIPVEIRSFLFTGLVLMIFVAIVFHLGK